MLNAILLLLSGLLLISWAANKFVDGATAIAKQWDISPLIIGLTIVALGTSAPEIVVAIVSSAKGNASLAVGNAIGSNIANIGLVLGVTALIKPLSVHSRILQREFPILFIVMLLTWLLLSDGHLNHLDGLILLLGLSVLMIILIFLAQREKNHEPLATEFAAEISTTLPPKQAWFWVAVGIVLLPMSAELIVRGAVIIAKHFAISDLTIGLTIVAIGTSLPEVATSIAATLKGEDDIAIGNIIGSNMFNLLAVLPFPALVAPHLLDSMVLQRDLPVMFVMTVLLLILAYGFRGPGQISRWQGLLLLGCYGSYLAILF